MCEPHDDFTEVLLLILQTSENVLEVKRLSISTFIWFY